MSQRSCFSAPRQLALPALALLLTLAGTAPAKPPGGGGSGGGGSNPPPLPNVRYVISVAPTPSGAAAWPYGANELGMAVGHHSLPDGTNRTPFFYHAASGTYYNFALEMHLTDQLDQLSPGWVFRSAHAINALGEIVGTIENPADGDRRPYVIDPHASLDVEDWEISLLPAYVSGYSILDINNAGDVLSTSPADGSDGLILYNAWTDDEILIGHPGGSGFKLNNFREIAVRDSAQSPTVYFIDAGVTPPVVGSFGASGLSGEIALSDAGVIAGKRNAVSLGGKKGKTNDVIFTYSAATGQMVNAVVGSSFSLYPGYADWLNASGDMGYVDVSKGGSQLLHRGVAPDFAQRVWTVGDLVADGDPWKQTWTSSYQSIESISERSDQNDATGYPLLMGRLWAADGTKCVLLTPVDVPAP